MPFKDFIPAGEDTEAISDGGLKDFVPAPQPRPLSESPVESFVTPEPTPVVEEEPKQKGKK